MNTNGHESGRMQARQADKMGALFGGRWSRLRVTGSGPSLFVWIRVHSWLNQTVPAYTNSVNKPVERR